MRERGIVAFKMGARDRTLGHILVFGFGRLLLFFSLTADPLHLASHPGRCPNPCLRLYKARFYSKMSLGMCLVGFHSLIARVQYSLHFRQTRLNTHTRGIFSGINGRYDSHHRGGVIISHKKVCGEGVCFAPDVDLPFVQRVPLLFLLFPKRSKWANESFYLKAGR